MAPTAKFRTALASRVTLGCLFCAGALAQNAAPLPSTPAEYEAFKIAQDRASIEAYRAGDMARTREIERAVLEAARRFDDRKEEALSIHGLAMADAASGKLDEAEQGFRDAIAIWQASGDQKGLAISLRGIGRVQEARGNLIEATDTLVTALDALLEHGTAMDQSEGYYALARLFTNLEDYAAARHGAERAIELMGESPPDFPLTLNLATRSAALRELGQFDAAVADGEAALAAANRADSPPGRAIAQIALGTALGAAGDATRALEALRDGHRIAVGIDEPVLQADLLLAEGSVLVAEHRYAEAIGPLDDALAIATRLSLDNIHRNANIELEKAHSGLGNTGAALAASKAAMAAQQRIASLRSIGTIAGRDPEARLAALNSRFLALSPDADADAASAPPATGGRLSYWWWLALLVLAAGTAFAGRHALRLRASKRDLETAHAQLQDRSRRLQQQVSHDLLTGVATRRAFHEQLVALLQQAKERHVPVSLMMFDLDHFKQINDQHGHMVGDAALKLLVGLVREHLDSDDLFGRFGGDEFMIATRQPLEQAMTMAERIRVSVRTRSSAPGFDLPPLSISAGVAYADGETGHDPDALFLRADAALYAAKDAGRDRVVAANAATPVIDMPRSLQHLADPGH